MDNLVKLAIKIESIKPLSPENLLKVIKKKSLDFAEEIILIPESLNSNK